jgi:hypothetical protein
MSIFFFVYAYLIPLMIIYDRARITENQNWIMEILEDHELSMTDGAVLNFLLYIGGINIIYTMHLGHCHRILYIN